MARTFDAPNSDDFIAPIRLTRTPRKQYPFRVDLTAVILVDDFVQRAEYFEPLALDATHPEFPSAYLVNETDPQTGGDGLVRFSRTYATVPANRTEFERASGNFPAYKTNTAATLNIRDSFTQSVVGKVVFSYLYTTDPGADLTITDQFQPLDSGSEKVNFVGSDTTPNLLTYEGYVSAGTYIQASETEVSRWMGNIWQMMNLSVKAL